jgi:hypothetical protein
MAKRYTNVKESHLQQAFAGKMVAIQCHMKSRLTRRSLQVIEFTYARMVELVDTRDLKSRGPGRVRAGSSPAPGTMEQQTINALVRYWKFWQDVGVAPPIFVRFTSWREELEGAAGLRRFTMGRTIR